MYKLKGSLLFISEIAKADSAKKSFKNLDFFLEKKEIQIMMKKKST